MTDSVEASMSNLTDGVRCVDNLTNQTMREFGDENFEAYQKEMKELKQKWEITIDVMMIIGKYFKSNNDYINVMRICKRYHQLAQMYHFNPIEDCSIFENMETQYLYSCTDEKRKGMHQYVYLL